MTAKVRGKSAVVWRRLCLDLSPSKPLTESGGHVPALSSPRMLLHLRIQVKQIKRPRTQKQKSQKLRTSGGPASDAASSGCF